MTTATDNPPIRDSSRHVGQQCRLVLLRAAGWVIMTIGSLLTLAVATVTLFRARRFYTEVMAGSLARLGLRLAGIRVVTHYDEPLPTTQAIYISNHASTLDIFILTGMSLPNTRFFLSGHLRKKLPLGLLGYLTGVFWTVPQEFPAKRVKIFQRAERVLRRTGESVFLSPEGNQGRMGKIAPFNKGAFHLATNLGVPIIPMYIAIPRDIDPGWGFHFRPGVVDVYFKRAIPTDDWRIEDLDKNRTDTRDYFLELQRQYRGES
jgi:1-acyl-sn-glycerol-3-phosphate acyltransferase